jgi:hypothetical protein
VGQAHGATSPALHLQGNAAHCLPGGLRPRWVRQVHEHGHAALRARRLAANARNLEAAVDKVQVVPRGGGEGPEHGGRELVDFVREVGVEVVGDEGDGGERGVRETKLALEASDRSTLEGGEVYELRRRSRVLMEPSEERGYRTDRGLTAEATRGGGWSGWHCNCWWLWKESRN